MYVIENIAAAAASEASQCHSTGTTLDDLLLQVLGSPLCLRIGLERDTLNIKAGYK